jgi:cysteine synthase
VRLRPQLSPLKAIGNTPLVELKRIGATEAARILVKLEFFNPTGSYKDRMALSMIEKAEADGIITPGRTTILEYTGGSTGSSLGFVCAVKGYALNIVTSDAFSKEKIATIGALGARLTIVPSEGGRITPSLMPRIIDVTRAMAEQVDTYWTDQFNNPHNPAGHLQMGEEILTQSDGEINAFVAAVGTAGCLMGVATVLKSQDKAIKIFAVEPDTSAVLSGKSAGSHRIEGIALGFVPPLLRFELLDGVLIVNEEEARAMARRLSREEGLFLGTSAGANVVAALQAAKMLGRGCTIVVPAPDTGLKYVSTDLYPPT